MKKINWKELFKRTPSGTAIVLGNIFVIVCAVIFEWELYPLVLLYWLENGVIGIINILKMISNQSNQGTGKILMKLILAPFFCLHYFGFWIAHGLFVLSFFGGDAVSDGFSFPPLSVVLDIVVEHGLLFALLGVIFSHTFSLAVNYFRSGLYKRQVMQELMGGPYTRVAVLHIFIIACGFIVQILGEPTGAVILLAVMKTIGDLIAHNAEHSKKTEEFRARSMEASRLAEDMPADGPDAFAREHPSYTRDMEAEKNYIRPMNVGCLTAFVVFVGLIIILFANEDLLPRPVRIGTFFFSIILGIGSPIYSYYRRIRCGTCHEYMERGMSECTMDDLRGMERFGAAMSPEDQMPKQNWRACHRCKTYFLTGRTSQDND